MRILTRKQVFTYHRYIDSQTRNKHFLDVHPTSHLLTNLTPDTVYHITVAALSGDQEGILGSNMRLFQGPSMLINNFL